MEISRQFRIAVIESYEHFMHILIHSRGSLTNYDFKFAMNVAIHTNNKNIAYFTAKYRHYISLDDEFNELYKAVQSKKNNVAKCLFDMNPRFQQVNAKNRFARVSIKYKNSMMLNEIMNSKIFHPDLELIVEAAPFGNKEFFLKYHSILNTVSEDVLIKILMSALECNNKIALYWLNADIEHWSRTEQIIIDNIKTRSICNIFRAWVRIFQLEDVELPWTNTATAALRSHSIDMINELYKHYGMDFITFVYDNTDTIKN